MANNSRTTQIKDFPFLIKDKQGNEIYYEVDGYWSVKEYDSDGNAIYYEDYEGFWSKKEYDSKGNAIYYEDSNGLIRDNRPKPDEIITLNGIRYKRID